MKKNIFLFIFLLILCAITSCTRPVKHADNYYNVNDGLSLRRIPVVKPIEIILLESQTDLTYSWDLELQPGIWVDYPNKQGLRYFYGHVHDLKKFATINGIIMAYSSFVDQDAVTYIQDNFYHWFVIVPDLEIQKGFHSQDDFSEYIRTLGIENPDWQIPDEVYRRFKKTGCLEWIPDCEQK